MAEVRYNAILGIARAERGIKSHFSEGLSKLSCHIIQNLSSELNTPSRPSKSLLDLNHGEASRIIIYETPCSGEVQPEAQWPQMETCSEG